MGFQINTNVAAMTAHMHATNNNKGLDKSLTALSSGLRINKAADDAAGLSIANQLKSQAQGLGQAIKNANDGINISQTADGALDEYTNIINTVRTKAIQAASDGQNDDSRKAIQRDITKLLEEANNIAKTTSFNGQNLLDGSFQNKNFHVGSYSEETVGINIGNSQTNNIGRHVDKTGSGAVGATALAAGDLKISIDGEAMSAAVGASSAEVNGDNVLSVAHSANSAYAKAIAINAVSDKTEVTAVAKTEVLTANTQVTAGSIAAGSLSVNGVDIGAVTTLASDSDGSLMNAINAVSDKTHVIATNEGGVMKLTSEDGSDINITGAAGTTGLDVAAHQGKITLISDHTVQLTGGDKIGHVAAANISKDSALDSIDVTTREGAEKAIRVADTALKQLDAQRSNIGSTQNQLESTVRNISVTQVNVTASESSIRDVDFALESANLKKHNILAQAGTYAISQANAAQQNISTLLR